MAEALGLAEKHQPRYITRGISATGLSQEFAIAGKYLGTTTSLHYCSSIEGLFGWHKNAPYFLTELEETLTVNHDPSSLPCRRDIFRINRTIYPHITHATYHSNDETQIRSESGVSYCTVAESFGSTSLIDCAGEGTVHGQLG